MGRETRTVELGMAFLVAALATAVAAPSTSAFTMGSNLGREPDVSLQGVGGLITAFNPVISQSLRVGGESGVSYSPVNGRVIRWRIRTGDTDTGAVSLRIIRGQASPQLSVPRTGGGASAAVTPALGTISTYGVSLPIQRGLQLGSTAARRTSVSSSPRRPIRGLISPSSRSGEIRRWRMAGQLVSPMTPTRWSLRSTLTSSRRRPSRSRA
jgi:hypothetical protein